MPAAVIRLPAIRQTTRPDGRINRRVLAKELFDGQARVILEIDADPLPPVTAAMVRHIDQVRELLITRRISPDEAHAMLIDCTWLLEVTRAP